jgi:hypothetical protein
MEDFFVNCVYFTPRPWCQRRACPADADYYASTGCGGETIVFWLALSASLAVPVAVIVAVVARHYRTTDVDVLARWGPAVLLGVLWPVVLVVLAQLAISVAMTRTPSVLGSIRGFSRV